MNSSPSFSLSVQPPSTVGDPSAFECMSPDKCGNSFEISSPRLQLFFSQENSSGNPLQEEAAKHRLKVKTAKASLKMSHIARVYKLKTDIRSPHLVNRKTATVGCDSNSCGSVACDVIMWNGEEPYCSSRELELSMPKIPWFYDCTLIQNITFAVRVSPQFVPSRPELNWIAVNHCKFSCCPAWTYFDTLIASLELWQRYARLVVSNELSSAWTEQETEAVQVLS